MDHVVAKGKLSDNIEAHEVFMDMELFPISFILLKRCYILRDSFKVVFWMVMMNLFVILRHNKLNSTLIPIVVPL